MSQLPPAGSSQLLAASSPDEKTVISKRGAVAESAPVPATVRPADIGRSLEGRQLGQIRLEEFVGGGGMGAVFRGIDTTLDRVVAVKVVSRQHTDEDTLRRFRNEALSAARLDHPNIARVYSVGEEDGWNFIVFEFIEGVNIRDLVVHKGPLPLEEAISYVMQAADALEHAAQRDVVHRDIKPSNLLVMEDGRAKLVDMGLARLHQVESSANDLTETGVTLGTFDYISPEQARDPRNTDVRSDLYSLGCTFYYMLTGIPPFPEGTVLQKLLSHSSEDPPNPRDLRPDVPPEISAILLKLMAKQPAQRYQRPSELVVAMRTACEKLGLVAPATTLAATPQIDSWLTRVPAHLPWVIPFLLLPVGVFVLEAMLPGAVEISRERRMPKLGDAIAPPTVEGTAETPTTTSEAVEPKDVPGTVANRLPGESPTSQSHQTSTRPAETNTNSVASSAVDATTPAHFEESSASIELPLVEVALKVAPDGDVTVSSDSQDTDVGGLTSPAETEGSRSLSAGSVARTSRLVVFPSGPPTPDPLVVKSLEEAIRMIGELPQVNTIELRCNECVVSPLTLDLRNDLTIEAAPGFTPLLAFQPDDVFGDRRMLNVLGGRLTLRGIHFQVALPGTIAEGWSLFYLNQVKEIALANCSMTIENTARADAAFFHVQGPAISDIMMDEEESMPATRPSIRMDSCIARGAAKLVRATDGLLFKLNWTQGFLATTERLAELSNPNQAVSVEVARISLRHVTAIMERGLCLVSIEDPAARLPQVAVDCESCLLDHNEQAALIEHDGVADVSMTLHSALSQAGRSNAYPRTDVCWRIRSLADGDFEVRWGERNDYDWYTEASSEKYTPWLYGPPSSGRAMHLANPNDYLVEDELLGFDPGQLPTLPAVSSPTQR